jgi:hypothetical protein
MIHITSNGGQIGNWRWLNAKPHEMYLDNVFMAGARVHIFDFYWGQVWFQPPDSLVRKVRLTHIKFTRLENQ